MQEINELKDSFVDNLLPLKIYLFGSMAEGKGNEDKYGLSWWKNHV